MAKPGRKHVPNVDRYPGGQIVHAQRQPKAEKPEKIMAVVLAQPHRRGERSQLAGFAFGRLRLGGMIDERQYRAAEIFTKRASRYMTHITCTNPRFPNPLANMVKLDLEDQKAQERERPVADFTIRDEPHDEVSRIASIRSDYAELQDALADAGMHFEGNAVLSRVCIMDRDIEGHAAMGAFRRALNVIANRLKL